MSTRVNVGLVLVLSMGVMAAVPALAQEGTSTEGTNASATPRVVPFRVRQVAVECNGPCVNINLGQACGRGWTPIAVDCEVVTEQFPDAVACGSPPTLCARFGVTGADLVSDFCQDTAGFDANVYCAR